MLELWTVVQIIDPAELLLSSTNIRSTWSQSCVWFQDGAYLVRDSTRQQKNQPFTLMVLYQDKVYNIQIRLQDQQYQLGTGLKSQEVNPAQTIGPVLDPGSRPCCTDEAPPAGGDAHFLFLSAVFPVSGWHHQPLLAVHPGPDWRQEPQLHPAEPVPTVRTGRLLHVDSDLVLKTQNQVHVLTNLDHQQNYWGLMFGQVGLELYPQTVFTPHQLKLASSVSWPLTSASCSFILNKASNISSHFF